MNDIKIGNKLIIAFSLILVLMILIGILSVRNIDKATASSDMQAQFEHIVATIRNGRMHQVGYKFDRQPYRAKSIRYQYMVVNKELNSLRSLIPDNERSYYDSLLIVSSLFEAYADSFLVNALEYDSIANLNVEKANDLYSLLHKNIQQGGRRSKVLLAMEKHVRNIHVQAKVKQLQPGSGNLNFLNGEVKNFSSLVANNQRVIGADILNAADHLCQQIEVFKEYFKKEKFYYSSAESRIPGVVTKLTKLNKKISRQTESELKQNRSIVLFIILLAIMLVVVIARFLTRSIVNGINQNVRVANQMAQGDLDVSLSQKNIDRKDEIGILTRAFKDMLDRLSSIIINIRDTVEIIDAAGQELNGMATHISNGATDQAASVEEINATVEEIVKEIHTGSANAEETGKLSSLSLELINKFNEQNDQVIEKSVQIASHSQSINNIAVETNILSINASVEAARAGKYGKGFAVVAREVSDLAEKSKYSADTITNLSIEGEELSQSGGEMLKSIIPNINDTYRLIQQIADGGKNQMHSSQQISEAINELNNISQQNASLSEEMSASSEELKQRSADLRKQILFFKLNDDQ